MILKSRVNNKNMDWNMFISVVASFALIAFIFFYEGVDKGIKEERERILERYNIISK